MPINILMPALSPTMEEGTLAKWLVQEGDAVSSGDILAEIETDKATMEFEAVEEGVLGKIVIPAGTEGVKVNALIAVLLEEGEDKAAIGSAASAPSPPAQAEPEEAKAPPPQPQQPTAQALSGDRLFASPLARRLAASSGIDLTGIKGSGPNGRIVKADVLSAAPGEKRAPAAAAPAAQAPVGESGSPDADAVKKLYSDREFEEVKLDGMRRTIATRLVQAKNAA
jgi:pyruvate dehydrogenase E2 component (dihydrolipoamide acetyltransferase)